MERHELMHYAKELHHAIDHEMKTNLGNEVTHIIKQHAVTAGAIGFAPIPVIALVGLAGNVWAMYARINQELGIPFGKKLMKSIGIGVLTNVAAIMPGMLLGKIAAQVAKSVPGLGTVGGIAIDAATNYAITLVMGTIYVVALTKLFTRGEPITEDNLRHAMKEASADKDFVKEAFTAAKSDYKPEPVQP
jgi:uncharacterized protein (DUF697 family)